MRLSNYVHLKQISPSQVLLSKHHGSDLRYFCLYFPREVEGEFCLCGRLGKWGRKRKRVWCLTAFESQCHFIVLLKQLSLEKNTEVYRDSVILSSLLEVTAAPSSHPSGSPFQHHGQRHLLLPHRDSPFAHQQRLYSLLYSLGTA